MIATIDNQPVGVTPRSGWRPSYHYYTVPKWYPVPFRTWTFEHWVELDRILAKGAVVALMYEGTF